jgi:hypothetical protein
METEQIRCDLERTLADRIEELEGAVFTRLWSQFTESHRSWLRKRRVDRARRFDSPRRITGNSGSELEIEEWAAIENSNTMHIFLSIWSVQHPDIEKNRDIVIRRSES